MFCYYVYYILFIILRIMYFYNGAAYQDVSVFQKSKVTEDYRTQTRYDDKGTSRSAFMSYRQMDGYGNTHEANYSESKESEDTDGNPFLFYYVSRCI